MGEFENLRNYVADGSLRIIHIVGVPRSMSTALGRALNESQADSVFVNEPFNRDNQNIDFAAHCVLDAVSGYVRSRRTPVVVIVKNMASYVPTETYREIAHISEATLWAVRYPLVQIGSLLTRIVNDMAVGPGATAIPQAEIGPHLDKACAFLEDSPKSHGYSKTGWASIGRHYQSQDQPEFSAVVDGQEFVDDPARILRKVCAEVVLPFHQQMLEGWQNGFINVVNRDNQSETTNSAWTRQAATSLGIVAVSRPELELAELPINLRRHISEVALPTYQTMTGSDS